MAKPKVTTTLAKPPNRLIAVDPGLTTGWAVFKNGIVEDMGSTRGVREFITWLEEATNKYGPVNVIVVEGFKLFRGKAAQQIGSEFEAVQVIGACDSWALRNGIEMVKQGSNILEIAPNWSKMPMPKDHSKSHGIAAYNHAFYYLITNNMRLPEGM